ncbi:MAG: Rid family detoxifying hydrolase [Flavobacteriales bacterium]|nr:Rid family detoxifying hydrolase [Flavobacteriales bacterium]
MKQVILTPHAPQPIGPYSQAIKISAGAELLFISGQIAIDPSTGQFQNGTVEEQTQQVMKNLLAVLQASNMDYSHLVKTTIFLIDMADFAAMNKIYAAALGENFPARETVAVKGLPAGARVEISGIAVK